MSPLNLMKSRAGIVALWAESYMNVAMMNPIQNMTTRGSTTTSNIIPSLDQITVILASMQSFRVDLSNDLLVHSGQAVVP
jgi:hypothetical protein